MQRFSSHAILALAAAILPAVALGHADHGGRGTRAAAAPVVESPWGADYFPNVPLITQDGETVRFFDDLIEGKVVAINFIFTTCSEACPLETARLREVKQLLGDRVGRDIHFYSISIDPLNDTPAVLKAYAERFDTGSGWTFLTGKPDDIVLLRRKLGLYLADIATDSNDHNLSLIIGNQATGRWQKASPFENPAVLAHQLGGALHNWKHASVQRNDYAQAPTRLRPVSRGEQLFRTRCAACHTVGADEGSLAAKRRIGPDLAGVTKVRERAWLIRWLKEPDRMLAEKDPIATALFERYNRVPMPNLRLNEVEIEALIAYLEGQASPAARAASLAN